MMQIFVTGSSRSGTTMMSRILGNHEKIFSFNELHFFEQLCSSENLDKILNEDEALKLADRLTGIQREGFLHYNKSGIYTTEAKQILNEANSFSSINIYSSFINYFAQLNHKQFGCDQTPRNILYISEILNHLPQAKIICMVRDPRAVLLSQKRKWKRKFLGASKIPLKESVRSYFNYHPYTITKLWAAAAKQASLYKNNPQVLVLKFEDLVEKPAAHVQQICAFLNVEFNENMLQIPHVGSSNKTDNANKTKGISAEAKDAWTNGGLSNNEIYICQKIAAQYMQEFNYLPKEFSIKPYAGIALQTVLFPIKTAAALALNLKRVKNLRQAIKKRL